MARVGRGQPSSARAFYLPPWRIDIARRPSAPDVLPASHLARLAARTLSEAAAPSPAALGLTLADDRELGALNAEHMGKSGPTDVLSFPLLEPSAFPALGATRPKGDPQQAPAFALPPGRRVDLGDVVVSVERAVAQAAEGRGGQTGDVVWSAADELRLLVVHGILHVCGWDHAEAAEEAAMRTLERRILAAG